VVAIGAVVSTLAACSDQAPVAAPGTLTAAPDGLAAFFTRGAADPAAPTPAMADYLDRVGNENGAYDVGDLRKWLRTQGP
jgi:hypothetical protein